MDYLVKAAPARRGIRLAPTFVILSLLAIGAPMTQVARALPPGETEVTINMRDADIRALIQWIAEQTRRQIVIDPRVQGKVTIFAEQPVTVSQAYQIFLATLQTQGFTAAETDGVLKIFPQPLAKNGPRELITEPAELVANGQVMHVVSLQNVLAPATAELIRPLLSSTGYTAPLGASNSLLIADDTSTVSQLVELAQRLDSDGSLDVDVIRLTHANARDIAQVLAPLAKSDATSGTAAPLGISAEERSNTVLLAGDPASRRRARQLVQQLDQPISSAAFTRVVFLNYLTADELLPVLRSTTATAQKDAKEVSISESGVSIEASKSANALVLTGPSELLDRMQETIAKLDTRRRQVLVQALIVEVNQDAADSLGVQWNTNFNADGSQAATNFGLAPGAAAIAAAGGNPLALLGSGLTLGYLRNGSLRAVLNALASTSNANLLSTPSVMTLDNQEAEIIVGSNIPIISGQSTGDASGTLNPFTTIERKDIGVTLKLTPQISDGSAITLEVLQEVENIAADATLANGTDIVTNKRSINTKVVVEDTDVLVLGGLISDEDQKTVEKVPVLGDIPLVGALFRSITTKKIKRQLMVFIHPSIVDSAEKAEALSRAHYRQMQEAGHKLPAPAFGDTSTRELPEFETLRPAPQTAPN
jgi:general secretion pathway protein D